MSKHEHWTPTSRGRITVEGHEFISYRTGINQYALYCEAIDAIVARNYSYTGYHASVAMEPIKSPRSGKPYRFTTEQKALEAAVAAAKSRKEA